MNLDFTEDQKILRSVSRDFLQKEFSTHLREELDSDSRGYDPKLWHKMADLGWMGLMIPTRYGGIEGSFVQLIILLQEMGRVCMSGPYFSTTICALAILDAGNEEQREHFLTKIAGGNAIMAMALTEPSARWDPGGIATKAIFNESGHVIDGVKLFVQDAQVADYLLCVANTNGSVDPEQGITLFLVDKDSPGIRVSELHTIARDHQNEALFKNVMVPNDRVLGEMDQGWPVMTNMLDKATVAKCAEMVGGAEWVLETSVAYAKTRVQYGHPIGSYQAIQHYLADMWTEIGMANQLLYAAAWKIDNELPCSMEISMAKAWVSQVFTRTARMGVHIHGALGTTADHEVGLYYQRALQAALLFGDSQFHCERIIREIGLSGDS